MNVTHSMPSLLARVTPDDVITEPVPHIVAKNVLDDDMCLQLIDEYPPLKSLAHDKLFKYLGSNRRFNYPASEVLKSSTISPLWKEFVRVQTSPEFYADVVRVFGEHMTKWYESVSDPGSLRPGRLNVDTFDDADVLMESQISANTPVAKEPSSPRRGHIDRCVKLYFGLFYLRHPKDDSTGGDLELYRYKSGRPGGFREKEGHGRSIPDEYLEVLKTIPYERNTLFLTLNSVYMPHGVSVRSVTKVPRYFVNILGDMEKPLFSFDEYC